MPHNSKGVLSRPQSQVNKLNQTGTGNYQYQELGTYSGKQAVREAETNTIINMREAGNSLPGNKGLH